MRLKFFNMMQNSGSRFYLSVRIPNIYFEAYFLVKIMGAQANNDAFNFELSKNMVLNCCHVLPMSISSIVRKFVSL